MITVKREGKFIRIIYDSSNWRGEYHIIHMTVEQAKELVLQLELELVKNE